VVVEDGATTALGGSSGKAGTQALTLETQAAFLVTLRYEPPAPLSAGEDQELRLLLRARNVNTGWQGNVPVVTLEDMSGARRSYSPPAPLYPTDGVTWREVRMPLAGGDGYEVSGDAVDFSQLRAIELTADTWEAGFRIDFDGLGFVAPGARCQVSCPSDCSGRGRCSSEQLGCVCEVGATGVDCAGCRDGFTLSVGHCRLEGDADYDTWPNPVSQVNGDAWLQVHHQAIKTLKPRVLALNFVNPSVPADVEALLEQVMAGFREGSRPLGSENPAAEPGLDYELVDVIDLRDGVLGRPPAPLDYAYENSTLYPRRQQGEPGWGFDYAALFSEAFASHYGFEDPLAPGSFLSLCELIESGRIHELWLVGSGDVPDSAAAEVLEHKQRYDAGRNPLPSSFERCAGNGCFDADVPGCGRSVRVGFVNYNRGPGCYLHSQGHGLESTGHTRSIPALSDWSVPYLTSCGTVHVPPNTSEEYDYGSSSVVSSDCADYGRNVVECRPRQSAPLSAADWQAHETLSPDCGGAFLVYWYQHMPGFGSTQRFDDGREMLSVWPFLFY
jgi:hypothetical protein